MFKSIQWFEETGIRKLENVIENFMKDPQKMAEFVYGIRDELTVLALEIIKETLEDCNQMIRESGKRRETWVIVRTDKKKLITSLGTVEFEKTLFKNKATGERKYLLDSILGIKSYERLTEDAQAKLLEEAVQTSYQKAGQETSALDSVSRQTVKNKLHELKFPVSPEKTEKKKSVDYLYIDADEDHVALQFREKKGDIETGAGRRKNNCVLAKLVYVYEGIEPEAPKSRRYRLVNPHYFSGVYDGGGNGKLWDEVYEYLDSRYDLDKVKKIYLNADGGAWIQTGKKRIAGIVSVLDEFHLRKYMLKLTGHMLDSADDARDELYSAIKKGTKKEFEEIAERIDGYAQTEAAHKRISESAAYILSNWTAARIRLANHETIKGCSAEGHVSHVLSSRMSSRPMGWSRLGADKMARLRAYHKNGGNMLELVRKQENALPAAAGAENEILSCESMLRWERQHHNDLGKYVEGINHSISTEVKKYAYFNSHIWGL